MRLRPVCAHLTSRSARTQEGEDRAAEKNAETSQYLDKRLFVNVQAGRKVSGVLRGFDIFLNIVLDDAVEETNASDKKQLGTVVRLGVDCTADARRC